MAISFNPGQAGATGADTTGGFSSSAPTTNPNATPVDKYIPTAVPTIAQTEDVKDTSPLVFLNRNHSKFAMYFQFAIFAVFLGNVAVAIGLFMYMGILSAQVKNAKTELANLQGKFPKLELNQMKILAKRVKIANTVLSEQASVRTAFLILESSISNQVIYNKFSLSKSKGKKGYNLSFGGVTSGYENLYQQLDALQSKIFASYFLKPEISGIGPLDKKGKGTFKFDTIVAIEGLYPDTFTLKEKEAYLEKERQESRAASQTEPTIDQNTNVAPPTTP